MTSRFRSVWSLLVLLGILGVSAPRAEADGPEAIQSAMVELQGGSKPIKGYLARPKGEGPHPAIVIVHEWWGLSDWVKQNADMLAKQGYAALAVDLYDGKVTDDPAVAHELSRVDPSEAVADLKGGVAFLKAQSFVDHRKKIGVIGWCMGGMFSRLISQESEAIGPTVICYGMVSTEPAQIAKLAGKPVLGIFAEQDRIPVDKVKQFAKELEAKGSKVELEIYPGAGHGFMRPGGTSYKADAAADAWGRITKFFAVNLKG